MSSVLSIFLTTILFFSNSITESKTRFNLKQEKTNVRSDSTLPTGWYYIIDKDNGFMRKLDKDSSFYFIDPTPIVTARNIIKLKIYKSKYGDIGLSMKLDDKGKTVWSDATNKAIGKRLAFILDNKLLHAPIVRSQITGGMTSLNRGIYTKHELKGFKIIIENEMH